MSTITRHFVRVTGAGVVDGDLSVTRAADDPMWDNLPSDLVDVTDHAAWLGAGSMVGGTLESGVFSPATTAPQMLSKSVFLGILSDAEFAAMFLPASPTVPHAKALAQWNSAATPFSIHDPLVAGLLTFAEASGFITAPRKAAILAAMHAAAR